MKMSVKEYIIADRQWSRELRIAKARSELARAEKEDRAFWRAVLEANVDNLGNR